MLAPPLGGSLEAIILAGGAGTRLRPIVDGVPKPLAPINGRPFLELQLDYWIGQGIRRCIISIGYLKEQIRGHFGSRYRECLIDYAEEREPLGTGGGMLLAAQKLRQGGPFLVLNGDTMFKADLMAMQQFHAENHALLSMAVCRLQNTDRFMGLKVSQGGRVQELNATGDILANGGVYLIDRSFASALAWSPGARFSLENEFLPWLLKNGARVFALSQEAMFIDIGVPEDYARAQTLLAAEAPK